MSRRRHPGWVLVLVLATALVRAQDDELTPAQRRAKETAAQQQLEGLRTQIRELTERQQVRRSERDATSRALRDQDRAIAASLRALADVDARIAAQQADIDALDRRREVLDVSLRDQRDALAKLVRSAYMIGRHEELKLLLQQDDVAAIGRVLAYHRYFQGARITEIERLQRGLAELSTVQQQLAQAGEALAASRRQRVEDGRKLDAERAERAVLLGRIDADLSSAQQRLATLGKDERGMLDLLEQLRDVFADIPRQLAGSEAFATLRGTLPAPVSGKRLAAFGSTDDGGGRSSGMRLAAAPGTSVRAVAYGRVVFADWFKGYGLMVIVDHGDDYLSLYGYNEAVQAEVGDWVSGGDVIATSGASGGQRGDSIYFELRHNGQPIDPSSWLRR